jgi:hypothetical protein
MTRVGFTGHLQKTVAGLDMLKGLERFGGRESYLGILRSFAENTRPLLESMQGVTPDTLPAYTVTVHGIKGAARGICAIEVGDRAEALSRLLAACDAYDMDGVDAAMKEIEASRYGADEGLVAWLRENVDRMNFAEIKERLSGPA